MEICILNENMWNNSESNKYVQPHTTNRVED